MRIEKNSVVTLRYQLHDLDGNILDAGEHPLSYLHGGYEQIFPLVEEALQGKKIGDDLHVRLEPDDAFGEYDADLVRIEPKDVFPANVEIGMQFEGQADGDDKDETVLYTVTDVAEGKVVVDGNHPWAGKALDFKCTVLDVRKATNEELDHGHAHGDHEHFH